MPLLARACSAASASVVSWLFSLWCSMLVVMVARWGWWLRVVARLWATSIGSRSGWALRCWYRRAACALNPGAERADNGHTSTPTAGSEPTAESEPTAGSEPVVGLGVCVVSGVGGCWRMRWALVPPMEKDDTPAVSGLSKSGHSLRVVWTRSPSCSSGIFGLGTV